MIPIHMVLYILLDLQLIHNLSRSLFFPIDLIVRLIDLNVIDRTFLESILKWNILIDNFGSQIINLPF